MAINFSNGFNITKNEPIDARIIKTKAQMLNMTPMEMARTPDVYLAICADDGRLYLYNKNNTPNSVTGRYKLIDATLAFDTAEAKAAFETAIANSTKIQNIETTLGNAEQKTGLIGKVDQLDTKVTAVTDRADVLEPKVTTLETKVGDDTSGLVKRVKDVENTLDDLEPRIQAAEENIAQAEEDIEDIQTWINNVKLDGGEIKAVYNLVPTLSHVLEDSSDHNIEYKTEKTFEYTAAAGYKLPDTITVNGTIVGSLETVCGNTIASWSTHQSDEGPYGSLTVKNTTGHVYATITAVQEG